MADVKTDRPKNTVRVSAQKSKPLYADVAKHLLAGGEPEVIVTGLGSALADAVSVAEMLKNQGMVVVKRIATSRGSVETGARYAADKIEIVVTKSKAFDTKFAEQQKEREARKADREANAPSADQGEKPRNPRRAPI